MRKIDEFSFNESGRNLNQEMLYQSDQEWQLREAFNNEVERRLQVFKNQTEQKLDERLDELQQDFNSKLTELVNLKSEAEQSENASKVEEICLEIDNLLYQRDIKRGNLIDEKFDLIDAERQRIEDSLKSA